MLVSLLSRLLLSITLMYPFVYAEDNRHATMIQAFHPETVCSRLYSFLLYTSRTSVGHSSDTLECKLVGVVRWRRCKGMQE